MEYLPLTSETMEFLKEQLMETNQEKFIKICLDALDTDPSTPDGIKDELACAETMSTLIKRLFPLAEEVDSVCEKDKTTAKVK